MNVGTCCHICVVVFGGERTACRSWFFPSTVCDPLASNSGGEVGGKAPLPAAESASPQCGLNGLINHKSYQKLLGQMRSHNPLRWLVERQGPA